MNQLEAASIIEKQAIKSLAYKFDNKLIHPIRLIQASKSLIGLDLDNPNQKLLKFNSDYLDNNEYQKFDNRNFIVNDLNEVINIHDLERAFLDNDKDKAIFDWFCLMKSLAFLLRNEINNVLARVNLLPIKTTSLRSFNSDKK